MGVPLQLTSYQQLYTTLKKGRIYCIKGKWPWPDSDGRGHFFIVMNKMPISDSMLILTHGSRQVDRARLYVANAEEDIRTLVVIVAGKYDIWQEETVIDCNDVTPTTLQKLVELKDNNELEISMIELDDEDTGKIVEGILLSNRVTPAQKASLRS